MIPYILLNTLVMQPSPFPNFINQKKKTLKKTKKTKKRIYRFDRKKRISDSDCTAKNTWYKRKNALFYMSLKENITKPPSDQNPLRPKPLSGQNPSPAKTRFRPKPPSCKNHHLAKTPPHTKSPLWQKKTSCQPPSSPWSIYIIPS